MGDAAQSKNSSDILQTHITKEVLESDALRGNRRFVAERMDEIRAKELEVMAGGGPRRIEAQHNKGRLTARERISQLVDEGTEFLELGIHAASGLYDGKAPAAGTICGLARVDGRLFMVIANDATVASGAFFPMTAKKVIRNQNIALQCHLPTRCSPTRTTSGASSATTR